jgi:tryptophan-rich sensory protein
VLAFSWLAATAWLTLAVRHPFTLGIARKSTPPEYWDNPVFLRVNVVITLVWAVAFTLTAVAIAACFGAGLGKGADITCQVVGFVAPAIFTARYPKVARARALASADA